MASAGNITAVLSLNARPFQEGLNSSTSAVTKFVESVNKLGSTNAKQGITQLNEQLNNLKTTLDRVSQTNNSSINTFSKLATAINKMANGLKILQSDAINVEQAINTMNSIFQAFGNSLSGISVKLNGISVAEREVATATRTSTEAQLQAISSLNANRNAVMGLITGENQLSNAKKNVASASSQESAGIQKSNASMNQGVGSANRLAGATNKLKGAMSSLRMMVSMVGSMIAYNFVHNLGQAVNQTINAKSEMNGYFQMLGYTTGQVGDFNKALDETIQKFPRINKYQLGETISSIGVEFELTTKQMKEAMPVVSMITSEYLRAGRNVNEASLAVKDILQGQFQRLSRETGVKGEDLMEAGWSGDNTDVMGLLKALKKVGEDRNWDTFVMKANSLNDAVLIMQNRFGEFSADLVEKFQPHIVNAFNQIMTATSVLAPVVGGIIDWLSSDGIVQSAVRWGGLATAVIGVATAFVHAKTSGGLLQVAQMGLKNSIVATTLKLEAETVATYGSSVAIAQKVTGLEAETLKEKGAYRAILAKVLGLNMEEFAQYGLRNATIARILGIKAETVAEKGLINVLRMHKAEVLALGAKITVLSAIVVGLAVAYGHLAMEIMDNTDKMKKFHQLARDGKTTLKEYNGAVNTLKDRLSELKKTQSKYNSSSKEYANTGKAIKKIEGDINDALEDRKKLKEAIKISEEAEKNFQSDLMTKRLDYERKLNKAIVDTGISSETARILSNNYLREATEGADLLSQALERIDDDYRSNLNGITKMTKQMDDMGYSAEDVENNLHSLLKSQDFIIKGEIQMAEAENLSEYVSGWLTKQYGEVTWTITEFKINFKQNPIDALKGAFKGAMYGIGGTFGFSPEDVRGLVKDDGGWWETFFDIVPPFSTLKNLDRVLKDAMHNLNPFNHLDAESWGWDPVRDFYRWIRDWAENNQGDIDIGAFLSEQLLTPITDWLNGFMADPMGYISSGLSNFGGFSIFKLLFPEGVSASDGSSPMPVGEEMYQVLIQPIVDWWNGFMADPLAYMGNAVPLGGIGSLLSLLLPSDGGLGIWEWANNTIIQPLSQALWSGITSIPLVSDILALFGLVNGENSGSSQKGTDLGNAFKTAIENVIRNIPILGDILQILGLIPNANPTASSNGQGVGDAIKQGFKNGLTGIVDIIKGELDNIINAISNKVEEARQRASDLGNAIVQGAKNALDVNSPGIIAREIVGEEFGVYIPEAITSNGELAYQSAQYYGQQITDGISSVNTDSLGLDTAVGNYETDAQMIAMSSQMMGMETTTAFNDMSLAVNNTTATMSANVGTTYSQMQQKQTSSLQSMKTQNQTAYNEMYLKSNQSLIQMRDSTSNITQQMVSAWSHMKTQLVATANQLRSESTNHFNKLSDTIGSFYRKIQNPSNWGAGTGSSTPVRSRRNTTAGRSFARGMRTRTSLHGAGTSSTYTGSKYMTIGSLKRKLCPDGSCDYLFNGMDSSERVNVEEFLATITGEHGFGGWSGWNTTHFNHIKNTSDQWDMKSPVIQVMGGIPTNAQFKVGDFENGTPSISFDSFKSMAESIFAPGGIPYKHYMDSAWKGSWLGAIQAGACNCSDGAEAIIAFASACGFGGGQKVHGYWGNEGHFWAVINGEVFDTTAMQKGYGWRSPSVHGYGTKVRTTVSSGDAPSNGNKTVNVTIDMSNSTIYGVDDLDSRIKTGVEEGLKEQFNDPYTVELI